MEDIMLIRSSFLRRIISQVINKILKKQLPGTEVQLGEVQANWSEKEQMIFVFITPLEKTAFATFAPVLWFVLKKTSMASLKLVGFITLAKLEPIISSYVTVLMAAKCIGLLLPAFTGVSIPYQIVNKQ